MRFLSKNMVLKNHHFSSLNGSINLIAVQILLVVLQLINSLKTKMKMSLLNVSSFTALIQQMIIL